MRHAAGNLRDVGPVELGQGRRVTRQAGQAQGDFPCPMQQFGLRDAKRRDPAPEGILVELDLGVLLSSLGPGGTNGVVVHGGSGWSIVRSRKMSPAQTGGVDCLQDDDVASYLAGN